MQHSQGQFLGVAGLEIFWQSWREQVPARAVVAISHGAGEHSGRYKRVAEHLCARGYPVYGIDHRGHGHSQGPRALVDRLANAAADLDKLVELARSEHPSEPLFLLGHSLGGTIALLYASEFQTKLHGLILSGPVVVLEPSPSRALRLAARTLSALVPRLGAFGVDPTVVSRDPLEVQAYRADPLVHHRKLPIRTVAEIAAAVQSFPELLPRLELPLLLLHGSEDRLAPVAGSRLVNERAGSADRTLEIYEGFFHEILNELSEDRERVFEDITRWLDVHSGARSNTVADAQERQYSQ